MIAVVVVVTAALTLGFAAAAVTASSRLHVDPVDPDVEQRHVQRAIRRRPGLRAWVRRHLDRRSAGAVMLLGSLVVLLAVAVIVGLLLRMIDGDRGLAAADSSIAEWGAARATDGSTRVLEAITQLGARPVVLVALVLAALYDLRRRGNRDVLAFVAAVGIGDMVLTNLLKVTVQRDRPDVMQLVGAGGYSFPSGHTSAAAAAWVAVALLLGRDRSRPVRAVLSFAAVMIAAAVASSRALLGVHWFTDVVAGLAVGWGWYLLVAIAFGGRRQRLGAPVAAAADFGGAMPAVPDRGRQADHQARRETRSDKIEVGEPDAAVVLDGAALGRSE